ncbi:phosphatase PAP2 family protein [Nocardioides sp. AN3]
MTRSHSDDVQRPGATPALSPAAWAVACRRLAARTPWAARQALVATGLVAMYFLVRGRTEGAATTAVAHAHQLERAERILGLDVEGALQSAAARSDPLIDVANWIYIWGHWPVIVGTLVWLALRHRDHYRRLRDAMAISGALGMLVFVSYPVAPPRLVDDGLVDTVTERSTSYRVLQPPFFVDRYAAMPSLHVGWDLLVGIAIATTASVVAVRLVGWLLPLLMTLSVIVTANHYVLDVVVGVALVLAGHACALWLERRRRRRAPRAVS